MLKVPPDKAITGYVPCPECQTPCGVFFPKGGRRRFIPYLSCDTCKVTMQTNDIKPYIVSRYTPTLDSYAAKYKVDVSKEQEQLAASRWTENPDSYAARIQGMDDEQEKALKDMLDPELTEHDILPLPPVTIDNATQSVVGEFDKTSSTTSTDTPSGCGKGSGEGLNGNAKDSAPDTQVTKGDDEQGEEDNNAGNAVTALLVISGLAALTYGGYRLYRHLNDKEETYRD